jgi:polyisoprenoid-binding protein YceI
LKTFGLASDEGISPGFRISRIPDFSEITSIRISGGAGEMVLGMIMPSSPPDPLIDVLSAESFASEHVPGAVNFCAYETAFADKVKEAFPDRNVALTVCGYCDETREAEVAVEKLKEAGFRNVKVMPGGLKGWKSQGGEVQGDGTQKPAISGRFVVDQESSVIHWTGRNLFNFHTGSLGLSGGFVELENGRLVAAEFMIDMGTLDCTDLTDQAMNRMLITHLRSDDFFKVDEYPAATFVLSSATAIDGVTAGLPNYRLTGDLTLRGVTKRIEFDALVAEKEDGSFVAQAVLEIDRTEWGSIYGSGKFFARLGQHVVNDLIHLHLKVATLPK